MGGAATRFGSHDPHRALAWAMRGSTHEDLTPKPEQTMPTQWNHMALDQLLSDGGTLAPLEKYANARLKMLEPTKAHLADAKARANKLGSMLCGKNGLGGVNYFTIGSVVKRTVNNPVKDIDLVVVLDHEDWKTTGGVPYKPATIIGEVTKRLEQTYNPEIQSGHVRLYRQDHSTGLVFMKESRVNVDIVPAFAVGPKKTKLFEIPERSSKEWVKTSPKNQLSTLQQMSRDCPALRKAIRLLKHWRANNRSLPLSSFSLEILAQFVVNHKAPPTTMGIVEAVLKLIVETEMELTVSLVNQPTPASPVIIMDTGVRGNNVTSHLTDADRALLVGLAKTRLTELQEAAKLIEAGKVHGTKTRLRPFFGPDDAA